MFKVEVVEVTKVVQHPERDGLTVNTLSNGAIAVSNLTENEAPRYIVGDLVVHVPETALVPEWLLKRQDCWDISKNKGTLAGGKGNRVKNRKFGEIISDGMLVAGKQVIVNGPELLISNDTEQKSFVKGDNIKDFFGIEEWIG